MLVLTLPVKSFLFRRVAFGGICRCSCFARCNGALDLCDLRGLRYTINYQYRLGDCTGLHNLSILVVRLIEFSFQYGNIFM